MKVVEDLYDDSIGTDPRVGNYICDADVTIRTSIVKTMK